MAVQRGEVRVGARADRELARGLGDRDARPARRRGTADLQIVGEALLAVTALADRRAAGGAERDRHGAHPPAGARPVRAVPARGAGARAGARGELDRGGGADRSRAGAAPSEAALGTRLAAEIYGGDGAARGRRRTSDDNETRFVWLRARAPATRPRRRRRRRSRAAGRRRPAQQEDLAGVLGPGADSPGWLVRCLDEFGRARDQPDEDRVAAHSASGMGHYMFFVDLQGRARASRRSRRRSRGCAAICEQVRVLGSYPAALTAAVVGAAAAASADRQRSPRYTPALQMDSTVPPDQRGPCRLQSTGGAGLTVAGCSS